MSDNKISEIINSITSDIEAKTQEKLNEAAEKIKYMAAQEVIAIKADEIIRESFKQAFKHLNLLKEMIAPDSLEAKALNQLIADLENKVNDICADFNPRTSMWGSMNTASNKSITRGEWAQMEALLKQNDLYRNNIDLVGQPGRLLNDKSFQSTLSMAGTILANKDAGGIVNPDVNP